MVLLPPPLDQVAEAVYASYETRAEDWRRPHLGASVIGAACNRAIWYGFRWADNPRHSGRLLRLFNTGQREEERVIADLRAAGMEVWDRHPDTGQQFRVWFGGHFSGSCDGIVLGVPGAEKTQHLLEVKTSNEKHFRVLQREGVKEAQPKHYAQMQVYMLGLNLTRALYVCVLKDTDEIYTERVVFDKAHAQAMVKRADLVTGSPVPLTKISDDPNWFECSYCDHRSICHLNRKESLEKNCRTCRHSSPGQGVTWNCNLHRYALNIDGQRAGCRDHEFIEELVK